MRDNLTVERLKELLRYEPETGIFIRLVTLASNARAGQIAGHRSRRGPVQITVDRVSYLAHRLAWLYMMGVFPEEETDHENLDQSDNRWVNLRPANHSLNGANRRRDRDNECGFKGASFDKRYKVYRARIRKDGRDYWIGNFKTAAEANEAYRLKAIELFGEFARAA
jgi:hypothetical protein